MHMPDTSTQVDQWVRVSEAASILHVSHATVRRWAKRDAFRVKVTPGGQRLYDREDVERIAREGVAA